MGDVVVDGWGVVEGLAEFFEEVDLERDGGGFCCGGCGVEGADEVLGCDEEWSLGYGDEESAWGDVAGDVVSVVEGLSELVDYLDGFGGR